MTDYQDPVARPKVRVLADEPDGWWVAICETCPTTVYRNCAKSDVAEKARHHRDAHRLGRVPVVESEVSVDTVASMTEDRADRALRARPHDTEYDPDDDHLEDA